MKINFLLLLSTFALGIIFISCGSKAKTEENDIVGKWVYRSMTADVKTSDSIATDRIVSFFKENNDGNRYLTIEFTNEGKMITSKKDSGTYSISENKLIMDGSETVEFKIKSDTLSIFSSDPNIGSGMRDMLHIDDSVKIEKVVVTSNFIREK